MWWKGGTPRRINTAWVYGVLKFSIYLCNHLLQPVIIVIISSNIYYKPYTNNKFSQSKRTKKSLTDLSIRISQPENQIGGRPSKNKRVTHIVMLFFVDLAIMKKFLFIVLLVGVGYDNIIEWTI